MLGLQPYQRFVANPGTQILEECPQGRHRIDPIAADGSQRNAEREYKTVEPGSASHPYAALNHLDEHRREQKVGVDGVPGQTPLEARGSCDKPREQTIHKEKVAQQAEWISEQSLAVAPKPINFRWAAAPAVPLPALQPYPR